jgi:hypothetical protein
MFDFEGIAKRLEDVQASVGGAFQQGVAYIQKVATVAEECIGDLEGAESIEDVQRIVERAGKKIEGIPIVEKTAGEKVLGELKRFKDGVIKLFSSAANLFRSKESKHALAEQLTQELTEAKKVAVQALRGIQREATAEVQHVQREAPKAKVREYTPEHIAIVERQKARKAEQEAKKVGHHTTSVGWPATGSATKASKGASQPEQKRAVAEKRDELRRNKW